MEQIGFLIISLIFTGCATLKIIERYPEDNIPPWVKGAPPDGCFRGVAMNVKDEKEGCRLTLEDVKRQVCNSIGLEIREEYERRVMAYNDQVDRKIVADLKCTSAALLEDIDSSIRDTYFEKWIQKTRYGKEYFCNYYVLVYYPQTKINVMKRKTAEENEKRLHSLEQSLAFGDEQKNKGDLIKALRSYVYALFIADTLFSSREIRVLECTYKVADLVGSLHLSRVSNYSEKPKSMHNVSLKAMVNEVPAVNLPVRFELVSGNGSIDALVFTDAEGIATSQVEMASIQEDNEVRAFIDLTDIFSIDNRLTHFNEVKSVNFVFSTLSKVANVQGGTLYIDKEKESWLKKIPVLKFDLRELNGMGAAFDRYKIELKGLFECKHWLTGKVKSWSRSEVGDFNLNKKMRIEPKSKMNGVLKCNAWLINTFKKMSKEKHSKKIQLILTLYGKDDNGNPCEATMESTPIAENPF